MKLWKQNICHEAPKMRFRKKLHFFSSNFQWERTIQSLLSHIRKIVMYISALYIIHNLSVVYTLSFFISVYFTYTSVAIRSMHNFFRQSHQRQERKHSHIYYIYSTITQRETHKYINLHFPSCTLQKIYYIIIFVYANECKPSSNFLSWGNCQLYSYKSKWNADEISWRWSKYMRRKLNKSYGGFLWRLRGGWRQW